MKWFKHDTDAYRDARLRKLQMKWGMEGYGLYWFLLEQIASEVASDKLTFELEHDSEIISADTGIPRDKVENIMRDMVSLGLFEECEGVVTCFKLLKRIDTSMNNSPVFKASLKSAKLRLVGPEF